MKYSELICCEVEKYLTACNFTKDEEEVFKALCKDKSTIEIANILCVSDRTVYRIKTKIKEKISKCGDLIE